jgi:hypothetical protein
LALVAVPNGATLVYRVRADTAFLFSLSQSLDEVGALF